MANTTRQPGKTGTVDSGQDGIDFDALEAALLPATEQPVDMEVQMTFRVPAETARRIKALSPPARNLLAKWIAMNEWEVE